jgi:hypothetical protein
MRIRVWTDQTFLGGILDFETEDDERSGRPKSTRTEVNIAAFADLLKNDLESHQEW